LQKALWLRSQFNSAEHLGRLGTAEKFENGFLRQGQPSTIIRHENGAFRFSLFKPEEFENVGFLSRAERKHFEKGAS